MGTICLQCGDKGFTNAFVYCVKCLKSAVHRYCLDVIPETFDEFVHWACDDCEDEAQNRSAVRDDDAIPSQTRNHDVGTKKNDVETEEHVYKDGIKQSYDACTKLDLVERGETTNERALMQVKGKNDDRAIILLPADESKICRHNSPQQLVEEKANGDLMQQTRLSESTLKKNKKKRRLIKKNKKNKRRFIESTLKKNNVETEEHVYKDDPKQPYDACTKLDLVECGETTNECPLKGKNDDRTIILLPADESKKCRHNSPQQPEEEKANGNLMQQTRLSESTLKKNKKKRRLIKKNKNKRRLIESNEEKDDKGSRQKDQKCISLKTLKDSDIDHGTAENHVNVCNGPLRSSKKKKKRVKIHRTDSAQPLVENKGLDLGNQCADMKTEERNNSPSKDHIKNGESKDREERGPKDLDISCAEPVVMPIWRGSFDIWNEKRDILDGLIGHLSIKACQKVYEEACQFQPVLHLEMLPLSDVWPKSFETSGPRGDNIALYFFPSEISERDFDHLVEEMMSKELALKAFVQNAELLIFASNELPLLYWRFQHKYYLWGVFRAKQSSPSNSHPCRKELEDKNPIKRTDKTSATKKKRKARSPCSPLSNSASDGSGTPVT